ncbi:MAG: tRNA (adenosine(37)-N6)-dimethylallyltransferase MiaA [Clostridia bacterium]|nr:tRNA (adenosine(37)-N6)-dimethylallyltransferase MiaA [Clostridia bacterium]
MIEKPKVLLIGGPTAVGKTKLSLACAKLFDGEIISADCVQVYKHLNIGSAKISQKEQKDIKHHLISELEPTESFNVDIFKKRAEQLIEELNKKGKLPIIVGGTGLYMRALLFPYSLGQSAKDESIREKYEKLAEDKGRKYVHELLKTVDKKSADSLHFNDVKRVIRALEIFEVSGKTKTEHKTNSEESIYDYTLVALTKDRKDLYNAINARVDKMFDEGLLDEVEYLIKEKYLTKNHQSMNAIGYREFFDYFDNLITLNEVKEKIKQNTRNYAKRQITWFKSMPEVNWFQMDEGLDKVITFLKTRFLQKIN